MRTRFAPHGCGNASPFPFRRSRILVAILLGFFFILACHGVSSDKEAPERTITNSNAFRSLRLGQTSDPNSPVATTAAANNGEAVIVLNRTPGSTLVDHVLYLTESSEVVRVSFADGILPSSAEAAGIKLSFNNYRSDSVDIQIIPPSGASFTLNVPFDTASIKLISQLVTNTKGEASRLNREGDTIDVLRVLYTKAIVGIRLFGCGSQSVLASNGISLPPTFTQVSQSACNSLIVDLLRAFIAGATFVDTTIPNLLDDSACQFTDPSWIEDFSRAAQCASAIGEQLIDVVVRIFPPITIAVQGTPTPTPAPISTPKPSDEDDKDEDELRCDKGKFRCANGERTCNERACNGENDCRDGSDEDSSLCTAEVLCCINSNGCPGEGGGSCTETCCCCPSGEKCSKSPYLSGCIPD